MTDNAYKNTDRELWREREGDYYANSVFVTDRGGIGFNVGGFCVVRTPAEWVALEYPPCSECGTRIGHIHWCSSARRRSWLRRVFRYGRTAPMPPPGEDLSPHKEKESLPVRWQP